MTLLEERPLKTAHKPDDDCGNCGDFFVDHELGGGRCLVPNCGCEAFE